MVFGVFIILLNICAFAIEKPQVRFLQQVEVSQKAYLSVADIVEVINPTRELLLDLEQIMLPIEDHDYELTQAQIRQALKSFQNEDRSKLDLPTWIIPQKVQIKLSTNIISKQEVTRRIQQFLQLNCKDCEYEIQISNLPTVKSPHWKVKYQDITDQNQFLISIDENSQSNNRWIAGLIKKYKNIPVANRMIKYGEKLSAEMFYEKRVDISQSKDAPIQVDKIIGRLLNRQINVGQPVWMSDLQKQIVIQRGQMIKALMNDEAVEISFQAQSEDAGQVGDIVKIKNLESNKIFSAKVIDENKVEIK